MYINVKNYLLQITNQEPQTYWLTVTKFSEASDYLNTKAEVQNNSRTRAQNVRGPGFAQCTERKEKNPKCLVLMD